MLVAHRNHGHALQKHLHHLVGQRKAAAPRDVVHILQHAGRSG